MKIYVDDHVHDTADETVLITFSAMDAEHILKQVSATPEGGAICVAPKNVHAEHVEAWVAKVCPELARFDAGPRTTKPGEENL